MGQIEDLKIFVTERLHTAASEILGAIEKTITDYEEQTTRLKEENDRHRSLLDMILKAKLPQKEAGHANQRAPAATSPCSSDSSPPRKARKGPGHSSDLQCVFTSRTDFLKFAAEGNCPYCLKTTEATETHLMRKHYLFAVHFTEGGKEKFVVPCMCKDRIQRRSHWHCPYCRKIIYRKCNFERHISKQHCYAILQQSQDAEVDQPSGSTFEEEAPLSPEPWCQQELGNLDQEDEKTSRLHQIKEEQDMSRLVSHSELQNTEQLQIKGEQMPNSQMGEQSLETDHTQYSAFNIVCVGSYIQDPSKINSEESSKGRPLCNSSTQPLEPQPGSGVGGIWQPAGECQHTAEDKIEEWKTNHTPSGLKAPSSKRRKFVKRSLPSLSLNIKKSTQLTVSQSATGPHCCKACGKTFHYIYTLKTHAQAHAADKTRMCGICGKCLESKESFVQHLHSHTKRNKCGVCGKQFSNNSRLKRHRRFHGPKGLNVLSSV